MVLLGCCGRLPGCCCAVARTFFVFAWVFISCIWGVLGGVKALLISFGWLLGSCLLAHLKIASISILCVCGARMHVIGC